MKHRELKGDIVAVSNTENGWVSKGTKLVYLEFLESHGIVGPHVIPKLVTFDGHYTNMTMAVRSFCKSNNKEAVAGIAHLTHKTQSADAERHGVITRFCLTCSARLRFNRANEGVEVPAGCDHIEAGKMPPKRSAMRTLDKTQLGEQWMARIKSPCVDYDTPIAAKASDLESQVKDI
eukprot:jgi/Tetstr1/466636/TSEL_011124.t1